MAYRIIDKQYCACVDDYRLTIIADTDEDVLDLPLACVGSIVIVADRGNEYMANSAGGWVFKSGDESRAVKYVMPDELGGTWQFNDTLVGRGGWNVDFVFGGTYGGKVLSYDDGMLWLEYDFDDDGNMDSDDTPYDGYWYSGYAPTITVQSTVNDVEDGEALLEWLKANAIKID